MAACGILYIQLHTAAIDFAAHYAARGHLLGIELPALLRAGCKLALYRLPHTQ